MTVKAPGARGLCHTQLKPSGICVTASTLLHPHLLPNQGIRKLIVLVWKRLVGTRFPIWQLKDQQRWEGVEPGIPPTVMELSADSEPREGQWSVTGVQWADMGSRNNWQWWPWKVTAERLLARGLEVSYIPDPTMGSGLASCVRIGSGSDAELQK